MNPLSINPGSTADCILMDVPVRDPVFAEGSLLQLKVDGIKNEYILQ